MGRLIGKDILLGVGIGVVISAIAVGFFGNGSARISQAEIIEKAREIGMRFPGEAGTAKADTGIARTDVGTGENGAGTASANSVEDPSRPAIGRKMVTLIEGLTAAQIARMLHTHGAIGNEEEFLAEAERRGFTRQLIAGNYWFRQNESVEVVVDRLIRGDLRGGE
ncbi:MAG: hypothetical protein M1379_10565 [Firmicutes bacterium]|nr:hypothetical protein [Bacillota bacterium]